MGCVATRPVLSPSDTPSPTDVSAISLPFDRIDAYAVPRLVQSGAAGLRSPVQQFRNRYLDSWRKSGWTNPQKVSTHTESHEALAGGATTDGRSTTGSCRTWESRPLVWSAVTRWTRTTAASSRTRRPERQTVGRVSASGMRVNERAPVVRDFNGARLAGAVRRTGSFISGRTDRQASGGQWLSISTLIRVPFAKVTKAASVSVERLENLVLTASSEPAQGVHSSCRSCGASWEISNIFSLAAFRAGTGGALSHHPRTVEMRARPGRIYSDSSARRGATAVALTSTRAAGAPCRAPDLGIYCSPLRPINTTSGTGGAPLRAPADPWKRCPA